MINEGALKEMLGTSKILKKKENLELLMATLCTSSVTVCNGCTVRSFMKRSQVNDLCLLSGGH